MSVLKIKNINVINESTILVEFSASLNVFINSSNIEIESNSSSVENPSILKVVVKNNNLTITTSPLQSYSPYFIKFKSSESVSFKSKNGTDFLQEDDFNNVYLILGAEESDNDIRDALIAELDPNIWDPAPGTLIRDVYNLYAKNFRRARSDIRQAKNENYLSFLVDQERKIRGAGRTDRLNEESAFNIIKVSKFQNNSLFNEKFIYEKFPEDVISLQQTNVVEQLTPGNSIGNYNNLLLKLSNKNVLKVNSVTIQYSNGNTYIYPVDVYGYFVKDDFYDKSLATSNISLEDNEVLLSNSILADDAFVKPINNDKIIINYAFKALNKIISEDTIQVCQIKDILREEVEPILNIFNLKNFPIVNSSGETASLGLVEFLNPKSNPPFSEAHPAFTKEIVYRLERLPNAPGEYSVDYATGTVYVFGSDSSATGTGEYPPVANYKYKKTFIKDLDYGYDNSTYNLTRLPLRDLANQEAYIQFSYENLLIPGVDYIAQTHAESLNERVQNRIYSTNSLKVLNSPITSVFRIYNETSGELYQLDRFYEDRVYFNYNKPPEIKDNILERASFENIENETLFVNEELYNNFSIKIFKILLENSNIISASEDAIGSSYNTSVNFSNKNIFAQELYFDGQELILENNLDKLQINQYLIDYINGVVYVAVSNTQNYDLGLISYKSSYIITSNSHILSVKKIYSYLNNSYNKNYNILSFEDQKVLPAEFSRTDERYLEGNVTSPYIYDNGIIEVTDDILFVRGVYDAYDLNNSVVPTNFGENCSFDNNIITINSIEKTEVLTISPGLVINVSYLTPGAEISEVLSVIRVSDNVELFDGYGSFSNYQITLSGTNSPVSGQEVIVKYKLSLNGASTPIIDYNRGELYIDYENIVDEILISYEYGDNEIYFPPGSKVSQGNEYFVTYQAGALRDALLKNFGSIINIKELNNLDVDLERERYRDALIGAWQTLSKGPTLDSLKTLVRSISHITPEIIEGAFIEWVLGSTHLMPNKIKQNNIELSPGKFGSGALVKDDGYIYLNANSYIKLSEGTLETWITPEWYGLDNDAELKFYLEKNNSVISQNNIYIGYSSFNPELNNDNTFTIKKEELTSGIPNKIYTHTGIFIYFDLNSNAWKVLARESDQITSSFYGEIETSGEFYNSKFIPGLGEVNDKLTTRNKLIKFNFNLDSNDNASPDGYDGYDGYVAGYSFDGITFMSDEYHYFIDIGKESSKNRLSLFKDGSGYLTFRVYDNTGENTYSISADISGWKPGDSHHVAMGWKLNSIDSRDEMHLFIDGFEVPNIIKYGGRPETVITDRFRTVKPEILVGTLPDNIVTGSDLVINNTNVVYSESLDFSALGINPGDTLEIIDLNLGTFTISAVVGNFLTLSTSVPSSLTGVRFTINPYESVVSTPINMFSNIAVYLIRGSEEIELPGVRAEIPGYEIYVNTFGQDVIKILGNALAGDQIAIKTLGLNHRRHRQRYYRWGNNSNVLKTKMPVPANLDQVSIKSVILPRVAISLNNAVYTTQYEAYGLIPETQPSNNTEGRTLSISLIDGNVNFTSPASITINGTTFGGPAFETLLFNSAGTQNTINKFLTVSSIDVLITPYDNTKPSGVVEIKEAYSLLNSEGNSSYPVLAYSYLLQTSSTLEGQSGSDIVVDSSGYFTDEMVGEFLIISDPISVAGSYRILEKIDVNTVKLDSVIGTSFTNGQYSVYKVALTRTGFNNGYFTFIESGSYNNPYLLPQGYYDLDYSSFLSIKIDPFGKDYNLYIGSDLSLSKQADATFNELRSSNILLSDVRIGEADTNKNITSSYLKLSRFSVDFETLLLLPLDELPVVNKAQYYKVYNNQYLQHSRSVNSNFKESLLIKEAPLTIENNGYLNTSSEGTIEFWVSPNYDTFNDPNIRFYFDATSSISETVTSSSRRVIEVSSSVKKVLSVTLASNPTGKNYAKSYSVQNNVITLNESLPYQNAKYIVNYIQKGTFGDRLSIYKDQFGYLNFYVKANETEFKISEPIFWAKDSWHRIRATFKFNRKDNLDQIRLFIDGEDRGVIRFGQGLLFGSGIVFGQALAGEKNVLVTDINFKDTINYFNIGGTFDKVNTAHARFDNLKISNISRNPLVFAGQARDINYLSNTNAALPAVSDLYTTYLLNFNTLLEKVEEFAISKNKYYSIYNFIINIFDSFDIVSSSDKVKQILESLIKLLKPAQSKVKINYF